MNEMKQTADFSDNALHIGKERSVITGSMARSANLPVFSLLRGQF